MSFAAAFKLVLITPVLLLPAAVWILAFTLSQRDKIVASTAAIAILPMLIDYHLLHPVGLNHQGTFLIGLYSQPLGFVLLVAWYVVYTRSRRMWHFSLAAILLALTILANFFGAVVGALALVSFGSAWNLAMVEAADGCHAPFPAYLFSTGRKRYLRYPGVSPLVSTTDSSLFINAQPGY